MTIVCMLTFITVLWFPSLANAKEIIIPEMDVQNQFEADSIKGLTTEWLLFEGHITPKQIIENNEQGRIVQTPVRIDELSNRKLNEATFTLYLDIPRENIGKMLEIHIPFPLIASDFYIDENLVTPINKKNEGLDEAYKKLASNVILFRPEISKVLFTMQVSDLSAINSNTIDPLFIGVADSSLNAWNVDFFWNSLFIGCNLMIGLFFISISMYRSYGKDILIFGAFCIAISIRAFFGVPYIYAITMPDFSWVIALRMEYIFTCIATFFFIYLIYTIVEGRFNKKMFAITNLLLLISSAFIIFTKAEIYQPLFFALYIWCVPLLIYVVYVLAKAIYMKNDVAVGHAIGIFVVFVMVLLDYLSGLKVLNLPPLTLLGTTLYIMIQMVFLSKRFSFEVSSRIKLNTQLTELNHDLDEKIDRRTKELQEANAMLHTLANKDSLTGIYNRHYFNDFMAKEFKSSFETHLPLAILIIDVDDFKKYNDFYGHIEGDFLLQRLSNKMSEHVPENGLLARYGGEEFVMVIPNMEKELLAETACRIQQSIEAEQIVHEGTASKIVTISIGVATLGCENQYSTVNEFIDAADQKLYKGKKSGKNIVVF